jgi:hypothetical protein
MTSHFSIPVGLGLTSHVDRAMHALAAIRDGDDPTTRSAGLAVAAQRWEDVAKALRAMAAPRRARRT